MRRARCSRAALILTGVLFSSPTSSCRGQAQRPSLRASRRACTGAPPPLHVHLRLLTAVARSRPSHRRHAPATLLRPATPAHTAGGAWPPGVPVPRLPGLRHITMRADAEVVPGPMVWMCGRAARASAHALDERRAVHHPTRPEGARGTDTVPGSAARGAGACACSHTRSTGACMSLKYSASRSPRDAEVFAPGESYL